jgi:Domain of unknown function (DUF4296)
MYKIILLICCIIFASCNTGDVPNRILSVEKMRPILWQQIKADIYTRENLVNDSLKNKDLYFENEKMQMQIFKNYGISKEEFYESYNYYLTHEDKLSVMVDSMIALQTRVNFEEMTGASNNYGRKPKNIFKEELLKKQPTFSMYPDTLFVVKDSISRLNHILQKEIIFNRKKFNLHK